LNDAGVLGAGGGGGGAVAGGTEVGPGAGCTRKLGRGSKTSGQVAVFSPTERIASA
jgi:hypothetical protein